MTAGLAPNTSPEIFCLIQIEMAFFTSVGVIFVKFFLVLEEQSVDCPSLKTLLITLDAIGPYRKFLLQHLEDFRNWHIIGEVVAMNLCHSNLARQTITQNSVNGSNCAVIC